MKLKKAIVAGIVLSGISASIYAHEITGSANPEHYTIWAGQQINAHSTTTIHVRNTADIPKHFRIIHWCAAQGTREASSLERNVTLSPNEAYDEQNVDCYVPFKTDIHNSTAWFHGGINVTPDGEVMTQIRGENYINVY